MIQPSFLINFEALKGEEFRVLSNSFKERLWRNAGFRSFKRIDLTYVPMRLRLGGHSQDLLAKKLPPALLPSRSHQPQAL